MADDIALLVAIAEIAGVFVGFGALISVTRGSQIEASLLSQIRAVVTIGLVVIVAALIPAGLSRYGLAGHDLWLPCSVIFLVLIWLVTLISLRRSENKAILVTRAQTNPAMLIAFWLLLELPMQIPLVLTVLGLYPDLAPAFYITALVLNLFEAAFVLAQLV
ncbi:MAG: hypothetical protein KDD77_01620, partial [Caldilineaceae bacterium]|nr:hypothetical protein [Caldilineaceae bacterium]